MTRTIAAVIMAGCLAGSAALAQSHQPYAGLQSRSVKAFSEEQLADLREGRGMGFALAAELNGYPGPMHVMEYAEELRLTTSQRTRLEQLVRQMRSEAVTLGSRLIAEETELDRLFATRRITVAALDKTIAAVGQTQARLRATHLRYHLLTAELLTADQMRRYEELRGYTGSVPARGPHQRRH
jgi:hypothetical protein